MLELLDQKLFILINSRTSNAVFDLFFPWWTDFQKSPWFLFMGLPTLLIVLLLRTRLKVFFVFLGAVAVASLADLISSEFIKEIVQRPRPLKSAISEFVILRGPEQGGYSFPSSHAVDAFAFAVFLGMYFPKARWPLLGLAGLTAYSRVYCGVHFPMDVLAGALLGSFLGLGLGILTKKITQKGRKS